ncbi:MAG: hypothetical protein ACJ8CR_08305 [Roseiflexaceae bacterium]
MIAGDNDFLLMRQLAETIGAQCGCAWDEHAVNLRLQGRASAPIRTIVRAVRIVLALLEMCPYGLDQFRLIGI